MHVYELIPEPCFFPSVYSLPLKVPLLPLLLKLIFVLLVSLEGGKNNTRMAEGCHDSSWKLAKTPVTSQRARSNPNLFAQSELNII